MLQQPYFLGAECASPGGFLSYRANFPIRKKSGSPSLPQTSAHLKSVTIPVITPAAPRIPAPVSEAGPVSSSSFLRTIIFIIVTTIIVVPIAPPIAVPVISTASEKATHISHLFLYELYSIIWDGQTRCELRQKPRFPGI